MKHGMLTKNICIYLYMTDVYLYFTYISYKNMLKANALITPKQKWEGQRLTNGFNFVAKVEQCLSFMSLAKY